MEPIDKAIELTEKKVKLLKELKQSQIFETMTYDCVNHGEGRHSLIHIATKKNICHGHKGRLEGFIRRRGIDKDTIYRWDNPRKV